MNVAPFPQHEDQTTRRLLKRLRELMAGNGDAVTRLKKIVTLIAAEMGADVCSCYIMRAGEVLELFATHGLRQEAVHVTRLRVGEGIVGAVAAAAAPLALANARAHPAFAYRPETGEDPFPSMMGVPVLRGGKVRGVLTIQHRARHTYPEAESELLQTVAMLIAELIASGDLVKGDELTARGDPALRPQRYDGIGLNGGLALGLAVLHRPQMTLREVVADDVPDELARLDTALGTMLSEIDRLVAAPRLDGHQAARDILDTYRLIAADGGWIGKIQDTIRQGLTAEAAVQKVLDDYRARFGQIGDPFMREKLADFEDMVDRLLQHLTGRTATAAVTLHDDAILVARSLGPAELLDYDTSKLRGLVLESGTGASHVAIIAKALDIPVIGQCPNITQQIEPLDQIMIDGTRGIVFLRPSEDVLESFARSMALRDARKSGLQHLRTLPSVTADGTAVDLMLNCGLLMDFDHLDATGAAGVGLYRTEIPFMVRADFPDVAAQTAIYRQAFDKTGARPLTVRTLDIGGDKALPAMALQDEANPALGWRAVRIGLDRPALLRQQLQALLTAAAGRSFNLLFPMVATVSEWRAARDILEQELAACTKPPAQLKVGVIVEVPSLLWQMPALLPEVDFLCVGTNDLLQYMFAADRGNSLVSGRYDTLSPAFLLMLRELVVCCAVAGKPLSLCGEMAGRPLEAMALLGLGVRALSMAPTAYAGIKTMLRSLQIRPLADYLSTQLLRPDPSLRVKLLAFARDHGVVLE